MPRPLHSDWPCVTLLTTTYDVTVRLSIDKTNLREINIRSESQYAKNQMERC